MNFVFYFFKSLKVYISNQEIKKLPVQMNCFVCNTK